MGVSAGRLLDEAELGAAVDQEGHTVLHLAVRGGHMQLTREILARGCSPDGESVRHVTPLHIASTEKQPELALELLVAKANPNATDDLKQTALHMAAKVGSVEVVEVLFGHGDTDRSAVDAANTTALHIAAEHGHTDVLEYMLSQQMPLTASNDRGWTALHLAAHGHEKKLNTLKPGKFGNAVRLLLEARADVGATDDEKKTPLHRAANTGNDKTVSLLLLAGADLEAEDICRWRPLHYAVQEGHLLVAKMLLDARAAVQLERPPCLTPLAVATMENHVKIAELLFTYKADFVAASAFFLRL